VKEGNALKSDWSKISKGDLITIHQAFEGRIENKDGTVSIHLNDVHWSRCFGVMYEIGHELQRRDEQRGPGADEFLVDDE
jgi:hypothetical protein